MEAQASYLPNEPTQADLTRALCELNRSTLLMAEQLMTALDAGREHFPVQALPILDDLSRKFYRQKDSTERMLLSVSA